MREAFHLSGVMDLTLESLEDSPPGVRPTYSMPTLAPLATHGSPEKRLTLQGIINAIQDRIEWYAAQADSNAWKVHKHNLIFVDGLAYAPAYLRARCGIICL